MNNTRLIGGGKTEFFEVRKKLRREKKLIKSHINLIKKNMALYNKKIGEYNRLITIKKKNQGIEPVINDFSQQKESDEISNTSDEISNTSDEISEEILVEKPEEKLEEKPGEKMEEIPVEKPEEKLKPEDKKEEKTEEKQEEKPEYITVRGGAIYIGLLNLKFMTNPHITLCYIKKGIQISKKTIDRILNYCSEINMTFEKKQYKISLTEMWGAKSAKINPDSEIFKLHSQISNDIKNIIIENKEENIFDEERYKYGIPPAHINIGGNKSLLKLQHKTIIKIMANVLIKNAI